MTIELKSIGKLNAAYVELNTISVISGLNDTGKSTVGKALYGCIEPLCFPTADKQAKIKSSLNQMFNEQVITIEAQHSSLINIQFDNKECISLDFESKQNKIGESDIAKILYFDYPFSLDNYDNFSFNNKSPENYREKLLYMLVNSNDCIENSKISKKLSKVVKAEIVQNNNEFTYRNIKLTNLSTGLKQFIILDQIVKKGLLNEKTILIIDEPEVHLHPKWQILFAEILTLIAKEFNVKILINSHSIYIIDAVNLYSKKFGLDGTRFYLTHSVGDDDFEQNSILLDKTDALEDIFKVLVDPLQILENISFELDEV